MDLTTIEPSMRKASCATRKVPTHFDANIIKTSCPRSMKKQPARKHNRLRCLDIGWQPPDERDRWGARRTLYHKSSSWWTERLGAAEAAVGFP